VLATLSFLSFCIFLAAVIYLLFKGGGSGAFAATVYNLTAIWVEKQRQKILKEKDINEDDLIKELQKKVESELRLDYLVTGSKVP
jgi:phosphoserine aminotransferase